MKEKGKLAQKFPVCVYYYYCASSLREWISIRFIYFPILYWISLNMLPHAAHTTHNTHATRHTRTHTHTHAADTHAHTQVCTHWLTYTNTHETHTTTHTVFLSDVPLLCPTSYEYTLNGTWPNVCSPTHPLHLHIDSIHTYMQHTPHTARLGILALFLSRKKTTCSPPL